MSWDCKNAGTQQAKRSQASRSCLHPSRLWCYPRCRPAFQYPHIEIQKLQILGKIGNGDNWNWRQTEGARGEHCSWTASHCKVSDQQNSVPFGEKCPCEMRSWSCNTHQTKRFKAHPAHVLKPAYRGVLVAPRCEVSAATWLQEKAAIVTPPPRYWSKGAIGVLFGSSNAPCLIYDAKPLLPVIDDSKVTHLLQHLSCQKSCVFNHWISQSHLKGSIPEVAPEEGSSHSASHPPHLSMSCICFYISMWQ